MGEHRKRLLRRAVIGVELPDLAAVPGRARCGSAVRSVASGAQTSFLGGEDWNSTGSPAARMS